MIDESDSPLIKSSETNSDNLCESLPLIGESTSPSNSSHVLEEVPFDIDIEKRHLETYAYRNEDPKKIIQVKNYNMTAADTCKSLFHKIEEQVLNQSESTNEAKAVNFQEDLKYIVETKEKINKIINVRQDEAIEKYKKLSAEIDEIFRKVKDQRMFENDPYLKEILEQKKLVMSNLSLAHTKKGDYKDAIDLDLYIIYLDPKFDKSYARLVNNYVRMDNLNQAQVYAGKLRSLFKSETIAKYENILSNFDDAYKKYEEAVRTKKFL